MANPTFTPIPKGGTNQTQKIFELRGYVGLSGNYTNATGIPLSFIGILNASGSAYILPSTFTGPDGPGQGVPLDGNFYPIGGYQMYYDQVNRSIRIFNGITEVATGAIPAALTASGIYAVFSFLRG